MPTAYINDHEMYYELHGQGPDLVCMGGWGTYCHGKERQTPPYIMKNYRVLLIDYRGVGESTDPPDRTPSMSTHADDVLQLCDFLGISSTHVVGLIGMGACVGQEMAVRRPGFVESLFMMGTWAQCDAMLTDQLTMFDDVHQHMGFEAFQKLVAGFSFPPDFYERYRDKILGPEGAWSDLKGRAETHHRLVEACLSHDTRARLSEIACPTFVLHAAQDTITSPRVTRPIEEGIPNASGATEADFAHVPSGAKQRQVLDRHIEKFLAGA